MHSRLVFVLMLGLSASCLVSGQTRRWAVLSAGGRAAMSNGAVAAAEDRVSDELTAQLTGLPGVTLIDRASVDKILKEQNFQNSDRSSADTAVRIGKLLGVGQIVLVQVYDTTYSTHPEQSGNTNRTIGTIVLRANARMIDVETAAILAQPSSEFQESVTVSETSKTNGFNFGQIHVPSKQKSSGGDPKVIEDNEWAKAETSVVKDLAAKLSSGVPAASAPALPSALVAGMANGSVYINRGAKNGIKAGDKFQIVREVSLGLNDPETGKPMVQKQRVCVLTIVAADDADSSGTCAGGTPQAKDMAEPLK